MPNHIINEVRLSCDGKRLEEILNAIQRDPTDPPEAAREGYGTIDFNKLIPMPEELNIESGSATFVAAELYLTFLNPHADWFGDPEKKLTEEQFGELLARANSCRMFTKHKGDIGPENITERMLGGPVDEMMELGKKAIANVEKYGAMTWYDWRTNPKNWNTKWNAYDCSYQGDGVLRFQTAWTAPHPVIRKLSETYPDVAISHEWADEDIGYNCGRMRYLGGERTEEYYPCRKKDACLFAEKLWEQGADEPDVKNELKMTEEA